MTAPLTPRICKREGCGRKHSARGMCDKHYLAWHGKLSAPLGKQCSQEVLLAGMPGTYKQIAKASGVTTETTRKVIRQMRVLGLTHIEDFTPPPAGVTGHWSAVHTAGPGEDFVLTKKMKREHNLLGRRKRYAATASRPRWSDPLVSALFGAGVRP